MKANEALLPQALVLSVVSLIRQESRAGRLTARVRRARTTAMAARATDLPSTAGSMASRGMPVRK